MKPRPAEMPTPNTPTMPMDSCAPARPAVAPATTVEMSRIKSGRSPSVRAASGAAPAARSRSPTRVRLITKALSGTEIQANQVIGSLFEKSR